MPNWKSAIGSLAPARSLPLARPFGPCLRFAPGNPFRGFPSRSSQQFGNLRYGDRRAGTLPASLGRPAMTARNSQFARRTGRWGACPAGRTKVKLKGKRLVKRRLYEKGFILLRFLRVPNPAWQYRVSPSVHKWLGGSSRVRRRLGQFFRNIFATPAGSFGARRLRARL